MVVSISPVDRTSREGLWGQAAPEGLDVAFTCGVVEWVVVVYFNHKESSRKGTTRDVDVKLSSVGKVKPAFYLLASGL